MGNVSIPEIARDFIINIINIIILFVIVKALVYKPVKKFLDARNVKLSNARLEAEKLLNEAEEKKAEYKAALDNSKQHAEEIIRQAETTAAQNAEKITENAKLSAQKIIDKAYADAKQEKIEILNSAQDKITELAFAISNKILKREINDSDNKAIAEEFFSKF